MSHPIEDSILDLTKELHGRFLLAVSGGIDSMCLWHIFRKLKVPHAVAHMNFQLRGTDSDLDEKLVENTAAQFNVPCYIRKVTQDEFNSLYIGTQEAAREIRYSWFAEIMKVEEIGHLCTAHQLDDSFESFLINLNRGSGLKGLGGIHSTDQLIRPLLHFSRKEITKYVQEEGVEYRDDQSNFEDSYLRNWFRNQLIPLWETKNPNILNTASKSISYLKESQYLLDHLLGKEIDQLIEDPSALPLEIPFLKIEDELMRREIIFKLLGSKGINRTQIQDLLNSARMGKSGSMVYSATHRLLLDRDLLILDRIEEGFSFLSIEVPQGGLEIKEPFFLNIDQVERAQVDFNKKSVEYLDLARLQFPLTLRRWQDGDSMIPLGMKGRKKVSDILIDEKVSKIKKENTYVLVSDDEVVCIIKHRISDRYKLNENSTQVLRIQW